MSRKVINVVTGGNSQFTKIDLSPIYSKFQQIVNPESEVDSIALTEEEVLQIYGVENLSMINNVSYALLSLFQNYGSPNVKVKISFVASRSIFYESSIIDLENALTCYRVYNNISFTMEDVSFSLLICIPKDEIAGDKIIPSFSIERNNI